MVIAPQIQTQAEIETQAEMYGTLAAIFIHRPNRELVANIRTMGECFSISFEQYRQLNNVVRDGLSGLGDYISDIESQTDEEVTQFLLVDWTRLFRGVYGNRGPKPPYESLWHGRGADNIEILQAVSQQYRQYGLAPAPGYRDRLDFLGLECEFMRYLFQRMAAALAAGDGTADDYAQAANRFFKRHIHSWAVNYCQQAAEAADTGFYRGFLTIARGVFLQGIQ